MNPFRSAKKSNVSHVESVPVIQEPLEVLCQGDSEMYEALGNFLYIEPERQLPQIGTTEQQVQRASDAMARGDSLVARVDFETAARIEMYKGNMEKVKTFLEKAQELRDARGEGSRLILISNLERAMEIAAQYYHQVSRPKAEKKSLLVMG